jgi:hypothetical protein
VGMMLYEPAGGGSAASAPPDLIPLDGGIWRNGKVHKVFCDICSGVISEHQPPPTYRWPSHLKKEGKNADFNDGFAEDFKGVDEKEEGVG